MGTRETRADNERYDRLQDAYLERGDAGLLVEMYQVAKHVAHHYLLKYCRNKKLHLEVPDLAHDAAMYIIEQYLKPKVFRVQRLSAYIYFGVIKVLYRDYKKGVSVISYDEWLKDASS
ncbi:MAG: hypothetical protein LBF75_04735 [Treponema sp.]|jgi:hypothetical protein|nr:hypothetical protein [Treponema sp.]